MGRPDHPVEGHVGIENGVDVGHRHDEVEQPLAEPRPHVEALLEVALLRGEDPRAHQARLARPRAHHLRRAPHPLGHGRRVFGSPSVFKIEVPALAEGCREIQLDALDGVFGDELAQHIVLEVPDALLGPAGTAVFDFQLRVHAAEPLQAQIGDEVQAVLVGAVDEHPQRVEAALHQAEHARRRPPHVILLRPRLAVLDGEHLPHLRGVEGAVAALDAVAEGVDGRTRHLVNGYPSVLEAHGRLEVPQVRVPRVVVVDRPASPHGAEVSLSNSSNRGAGCEMVPAAKYQLDVGVAIFGFDFIVTSVHLDENAFPRFVGIVWH